MMHSSLTSARLVGRGCRPPPQVHPRDVPAPLGGEEIEASALGGVLCHAFDMVRSLGRACWCLRPHRTDRVKVVVTGLADRPTAVSFLARGCVLRVCHSLLCREKELSDRLPTINPALYFDDKPACRLLTSTEERAGEGAASCRQNDSLARLVYLHHQRAS